LSFDGDSDGDSDGVEAEDLITIDLVADDMITNYDYYITYIIIFYINHSLSYVVHTKVSKI